MTSNGRQVADALRALAMEFPREFPRALSAVGLGLRKRMVAAIPRSNPPLAFAAWHSFTRKLKAIRLRGYKSRRAYATTLASVKRTRGGALTSRSRRALKAARGFITGFGGKLPGSMIYKRYGSGPRAGVAVGYRRDKIGGIAAAFQSSSSHVLSKQERHFRHMIQGENIDASYQRPARKIMQPFSEDKATQAYILNAVQKRIASIITKAATKARIAA